MGPDVVQRALDEPRAQAAPFKLVGDLGVEKDARLGSLPVDELADDAAVQDELLPARLRVVSDGDRRFNHRPRVPSRAGTEECRTHLEPARSAQTGGGGGYWSSVSILNIGRYMAMMITPTIRPTRIIISGSMIEVSDWIEASTSSS
jgi:hypothetical protein